MISAFSDMPRLKREKPAPGNGIVHLGLGAFFRAHGCIYTEDTIQKAGGNWGITGISLRSPDIHDALAPQDFAYTSLELGPDEPQPRQIGVVGEVLVARNDPKRVLDIMCDPTTHIVSLTITEKGYCHSPSTGRLDPEHPDIKHDIANTLPVSAPGFIVRALQKRRAAGLAPFTLLSCDNLPDNGAVLRNVVTELSEQIDGDLARWIRDEARFPATMVDRIVPATKEDDIRQVAEMTGQYDAAPVLHEPFRQWVIEDDFVDARRPAWEEAGAELVRDVSAFEKMKLRMLNGTHSALAYLGYLAGHETISECVADPLFRKYVQYLWQAEIIPTLSAPVGTSLESYADKLLERYSNPAVRHLTWQIAMDGSQKLPQRILGTIADNMSADRPCNGLLLALAGWMKYVGGKDENGQPIDVRDPLAMHLRSLCDASGSPQDRVQSLLEERRIFPQELAKQLKEPLTNIYTDIDRIGARAMIGKILN